MVLLEPHVVLASASPRRRQLLAGLGFAFTQRLLDVEENYPLQLAPAEVAPFLAALKADAHRATLAPNEILLAADTIVVLDGQVLGKPADAAEALQMLTQLSGQTHEVYTAVHILHSGER